MARARPTTIRTAAAGYVRPRRTGLVALAVPSLNEPYFAELASRFIASASRSGLSIVLHETHSDREREVQIVNGVDVPAVDGLIHVPRALQVADLTRRSVPGPMVLLGEPAPASPFCHVTINNETAGRMAADHLLEVGCTAVAMIGPRDETPSVAADRRLDGYYAALRARGCPVDPGLIAPVHEFSPEEGARVMRLLLEASRPPDGVVCSSDSIALGALSVLAADPGRPRVRVVGIDDIHQARFTSPALSSIAPDKETLVDEAIRLLLAQIDAPPASDPPVEQVVVPVQLVARASSR